eukprot:scaffold616_cov257-Pinguiococcus_pyrenoidosus.AAC.20
MKRPLDLSTLIGILTPVPYNQAACEGGFASAGHHHDDMMPKQEDRHVQARTSSRQRPSLHGGPNSPRSIDVLAISASKTSFLNRRRACYDPRSARRVDESDIKSTMDHIQRRAPAKMPLTTMSSRSLRPKSKMIPIINCLSSSA